MREASPLGPIDPESVKKEEEEKEAPWIVRKLVGVSSFHVHPVQCRLGPGYQILNEAVAVWGVPAAFTFHFKHRHHRRMLNTATGMLSFRHRINCRHNPPLDPAAMATAQLTAGRAAEGQCINPGDGAQKPTSEGRLTEAVVDLSVQTVSHWLHRSIMFSGGLHQALAAACAAANEMNALGSNESLIFGC